MNAVRTGNVVSVRLLASLAVCTHSLLLAGTDSLAGRGIAIHRLGGGDVQLSWLGITHAPYDVQASTGLITGAWSKLSTVSGLDGVTSYSPPASDSPSRFFRVLFPQPTVLAGEPAYASSDGGTVTISGQFFYPGDVIRIGGVPLADVVFLSPTLIRATLPPLPPGLYGIEVLSGASGGLLASLPDAIEVAPPLQRTLQEPAAWPPAGPAPSGRHRGHVTVLKSHDDEDGDAGTDAYLAKRGYD